MRTHISLIAALFLATGTAHAAEGDFNCDQLPKYYLGGSLSTEKTTKDVTFNFNVGFSDNRERSLPGEEIVIRYNMRTGKLWINGKRCKWGERQNKPERKVSGRDGP
jgi:hypothetical protein